MLAHERALVEMSSSARYQFGYFDGLAHFKAGHSAHLPHMAFEQELQVMARLLDFFEPFARIPVRIQKSEIRTAANLADITVGARLPLFKENLLPNWPGLTMLASVRTPTGAAFTANNKIDNESITTNGATLLTVGLNLEKEIHGLTYGFSYSFSLEPKVWQKTLIKPGAIHAALLTLGYPLHDNGYLSFSLAPIIHESTKAASKSIDDSDRRKLTLGAGYALNLHSHIKVNGQVGTDVPIVGKNFNNDFFLRIGLRFGVF